MTRPEDYDTSLTYDEDYTTPEMEKSRKDSMVAFVNFLKANQHV